MQQYLESQGITIITGEEVEMILGDDHVEGASFKSGKSVDAQVILQQMGIITNTQLAVNAGLEVEKGIIVNEYMQTSDPDIYAAGDCIQFNGQIWGNHSSQFGSKQISGKSHFGP